MGQELKESIKMLLIMNFLLIAMSVSFHLVSISSFEVIENDLKVIKKYQKSLITPCDENLREHDFKNFPVCFIEED